MRKSKKMWQCHIFNFPCGVNNAGKRIRGVGDTARESEYTRQKFANNFAVRSPVKATPLVLATQQLLQQLFVG